MGQVVLKLDAAVVIYWHLLLNNLLHAKNDLSGDRHLVWWEANLERKSNFIIMWPDHEAYLGYESVHPDVPNVLDCDLAEPRHSKTGVIQLVLLGCLDPEDSAVLNLNFEIHICWVFESIGCKTWSMIRRSCCNFFQCKYYTTEQLNICMNL